MKRSLILLMVLWIGLILTSCQTVPPTSLETEIPEFNIPAPKRPVLMEIPHETSGAIKALTTNLSLLDGHVRILELYADSLRKYYNGVIRILNQT